MKNRRNKNPNFMNITGDEKRQLKNRITDSIYSYIQRQRRIKYRVGAVAASVIIIMSLGLFHRMNDVSSLENFVKTIDDTIEPAKNVKLLLSDNQAIEIDEAASVITYSHTGQQVKIRGLKPVHQNISENKKLVFNTLIVPYGKRSEITLSDGSKVWLNSGSKLVFPAAFSGKRREVYLIEGEGIFEVAHDKTHPFIVKSNNNHEIEVLGTVFNVSNYADDNAINTVLKSGSVQINLIQDSFLKSQKSIKITPRTLAAYHKGSQNIERSKVDVEKHFSWRDGIYIFKNDALDVIMKRISRYYNIDIVIQDKTLANETFSGSLDMKDDVKKVINTIKETTKFQCEMSNGKLIIN